MKKNFAFVLSGGDWWKPFIVFWVIFLAGYIAEVTMPRWALPVATHVGIYFLILFALTTVMILAEVIFCIIALRIVVPKLSIDGKSFSFDGSIGTFVGITVVGYLLTLVTLTIYAPWFARRVISYLASETTYDGEPAEFLGKGGKLFVYFLLALWLPIVIVSVVYGLVLASRVGRGALAGTGMVTTSTLVLTAIVFIVLIPFMYLANKWYVNIRWNDAVIRWRTRFWPSVGLILGQILLTIITAGIYGPAALLRLYRYFVGRTAIFEGENEVGRLGFDGSIGRGFGLIWGQTLLAIVTLGVYFPWGWARIGRWMLGASYFESREAPA